MRPRVRSYGESSIDTLSPGRIRMKCIRILPEAWASSWWPFSSFTRKTALGRDSVTTADTRIASSFATAADPLTLSAVRPAVRRSWEREHLRAVLGHCHRVLEVGGAAAV